MKEPPKEQNTGRPQDSYNSPEPDEVNFYWYLPHWPTERNQRRLPSLCYFYGKQKVPQKLL